MTRSNHATLPCFKAYDIRGRIPDELNPELAHSIARAYAQVIQPQGPVAIGEDIRPDSLALANAITQGLIEAGVTVHRLGLCGTESVYFAAAQTGMGGGIMVTASHNPIDYNGLKLVRAGAVPISGDSGLKEIEHLCLTGALATPSLANGTVYNPDWLDAYVTHILRYIDLDRLASLHLLVNAGNGTAGATFDALAARLPFRVTRICHQPDAHFPNGIPNPLLPENRALTADAVRACKADLGIAWDGDFDRCFLFDEQGNFVEGYYIVGLLAAQLLQRHRGSKIIHDPRLCWNTIDVVKTHNGIPIQSKTGHAFIKERMRLEDAIYGGEMSAHHYFRDFAYCDSGMLPWLLVTQHMSTSQMPLSALVAEAQSAYPCSGEINFHVENTQATLARIDAHYATANPLRDTTDGLSLEFAHWRFNLRSSNTEPVMRLNVETRGDRTLLQQKTDELRGLITTNHEA